MLAIACKAKEIKPVFRIKDKNLYPVRKSELAERISLSFLKQISSWISNFYLLYDELWTLFH